jgi:hypothetical protein
MDENLIAKHMRTLKCTREEAIQLIQDDLDVDRGIAKPWDLTKEQIKNQRKLANSTTRKASTKTARTKKENPAKQGIITAIADALKTCSECAEVSISNAERAVEITGADGIKYTVTLTAHRAK